MLQPTKAPKLKIKNATRLVFAAISLVVAVFFLARACSALLIVEPGYQTITLENVDPDIEPIVGKVYPYYGEIELSYYFESTGTSRATEKKNVARVYNDAIATIFRYLDPDRTYTIEGQPLVNLAYINQHPNMDLVIDPLLYDIIKTSYTYSITSGGVYNLYAGELEYFWMDLLQKYDLGQEIRAYDPQTNAAAQGTLSNLVTKIQAFSNNPTQGFVFEDETYTIRLNVDSLYQDYIKVDLQLLEHAFAMEYIYDQIHTSVLKGFLTSDFGYSISLGANPQASDGIWYQTFVAPNEEEVTIKVDTALRSASLSDYSYLFYTLVDDDNQYKRHLAYSSLTGYAQNSASLVSYTTTSFYTLDQLGFYALLGMQQTPNELTTSFQTNGNANLYCLALLPDSLEGDIYILVYGDEIIDIEASDALIIQVVNG